MIQWEGNTLQEAAFRQVVRRIEFYQRAWENRQASEHRGEGQYIYDMLRRENPTVPRQFVELTYKKWREQHPKQKKKTKADKPIKPSKGPKPPRPPPPSGGMFTSFPIGIR